MNANYEKIISNAAPENFVGRDAEIEVLRRHAIGASQSPALLVSSVPRAGASELLRQVYDRLFSESGEIVPFYFAVRASDDTPKNCAVRFLQTFITQIIAFRHHDARIIAAAPDVCELAELAPPEDKFWIDKIITGCQSASELNDERAFVRSCLSAPLRAAAPGAPVLVIIDDLHEADFLTGNINLLEKVKEIYSRASLPFVLAGNRRFLSKTMAAGNARLTNAKILPIEPLAFADAGALTEKLAAQFNLEINESTRDLIAVKTQGSPTFIEFILQAASEKKTNLDSFRHVEQIYADEIFGGRTGKFYNALLEKIAPRVETQKAVFRLFQNHSAAGNEKTSIENRLELSAVDATEDSRLTSRLDASEIVRVSSNLIEATTENEILNDYAAARFRLEIALENRAAVVGDTVSQLLKRAPQTMAKFYRQRVAVNLRELLALFDRQEVPLHLLDYAVYKERLQESETTDEPPRETEKITLPQNVFAAQTAAFYSPFEQIIEPSRSAVARGFAEKIYTDADETFWLAAEIDSKLEASAEKVEFWCDRLEAVALVCDFPNYKIWLVAPEGFAPDALEILEQRNAFGSSRRQVELLENFLKNGAEIEEEKNSAAEYEIVLPMGDDSELIAAATVEEIARRQNFAPKAINQIKTAVVEACINAVEHSFSPERKIYQKIAVETDKIIITITNRGIRLADKKAEEIAPGEGRRGWGLKLMKSLMDEVWFEQIDDGTRISMTKLRK